MVIAELPWLHTIGQIAGVILVLELSLALIISAALMLGLAFGMRWLHIHVIPVVEQYAPQIQQAMTKAEHGSDTVVKGIAEFYGRRQAVETGLRVMLFGKKDVDNLRTEQQLYTDETIQRIEAPIDDSLLHLHSNHNNHNNHNGRNGHHRQTNQANQRNGRQNTTNTLNDSRDRRDRRDEPAGS